MLTGPEAPSHAAVARIFSQATGRCFHFEDVDEDTWRSRALDGGMSRPAAEGLIGLFRSIRKGDMPEVTDHVRRVTGRVPISLQAFARDHAEALCRQL